MTSGSAKSLPPHQPRGCCHGSSQHGGQFEAKRRELEANGFATEPRLEALETGSDPIRAPEVELGAPFPGQYRGDFVKQEMRRPASVAFSVRPLGMVVPSRRCQQDDVGRDHAIVLDRLKQFGSAGFKQGAIGNRLRSVDIGDLLTALFPSLD